MKRDERNRLQIGDRVEWKPDGMHGIVREVGYSAVKIEWNDGQWALMPFADENAPWKSIALVAKGEN